MAHYPVNHHFRQVYRVLAGLVGLYLALVGVIGLANTWGDAFFHRGPDWSLGLRVNPVMSWLILLVGLVIMAAAVVGGNLHHRVNLVAGWAMLAVAVFLMIVMQTDANVFNASMVNVIVLLIGGLVVLTAALYGKVGTQDEARTEVEASSGARA